mmetsp:Transcript_108930/g.306978  ORF Transcript_108930/g.306978 Transcript_108930/m.306978 type:complete len:279 (+) Transcript_108930:983-1819(+)
MALEHGAIAEPSQEHIGIEAGEALYAWAAGQRANRFHRRLDLLEHLECLLRGHVSGARRHVVAPSLEVGIPFAPQHDKLIEFQHAVAISVVRATDVPRDLKAQSVTAAEQACDVEARKAQRAAQFRDADGPIMVEVDLLEDFPYALDVLQDLRELLKVEDIATWLREVGRQPHHRVQAERLCEESPRRRRLHRLLDRLQSVVQLADIDGPAVVPVERLERGLVLRIQTGHPLGGLVWLAEHSTLPGIHAKRRLHCGRASTGRVPAGVENRKCCDWRRA